MVQMKYSNPVGKHNAILNDALSIWEVISGVLHKSV